MSDFLDEMPVHSSFIKKIALRVFDSMGQIHVTMANRATYVYVVPEPFYWYAFKDAASKGKYYNLVLKRRFDYSEKY